MGILALLFLIQTEPSALADLQSADEKSAEGSAERTGIEKQLERLRKK
jgi:hypothetical protein